MSSVYTISERLLLAQQYVKKKEWRPAKKVLIQIWVETPNDLSILAKLGDVCKYLHQNNICKQCYQRCINNDTTNYVYYYKMALLYHDLNKLNDAQIYYEKCLKHYKMEKAKNEKKLRDIYYHFAQLLMQVDVIGNYEKIKKYFDILLNKYKPSASLHFNYGLLLHNKYKSHSQRPSQLLNLSLFHFEKAIKLKPNIVKYHEEYAIMLASIGKTEKAHSLFERSSYLLNNTDSSLRFIYIPFEGPEKPKTHKSNHKKKRKKKKPPKNKAKPSQKQKEIELKHDNQNDCKPAETQKTWLIDDNYVAAPIQSSIYSKSKEKKNNNITMVIYDIAILAYLHSFKALKKMRKDNIYHMDAHHILDMFGGRDRIEILRKHFTLIKSHNGRGIKINIISRIYKSDVITEALKRVDLYKFFKNAIIAGAEVLNDIKKINADDSVKLLFINKLKQRSKFMRSAQKHKKKAPRNKNKAKHKTNANDGSGDVLFVDNEYFEYNEAISEICDCILIQHQYEFLLNRDMRLIEEFLGCKNAHLAREQYPYSPSVPLSSLNNELYISVRNDIAHASFNKQQRLRQYHCVNNMIIKRCRGAGGLKERKAFFFFAKKFESLCEDFHSHLCWGAMNSCLELMEIEPHDNELCRMLALCLSNSQLFVDAEYYYMKSLSLKETITCLNQYGHFLIMLERYDEACDVFEKGLGINPISKKALIGYARALAFLDENKKAEEYYKKCIEYYNNWDLAYFRYGKHCYLAERYAEAKELLIESIHLWPYSAWHHYFLALTYNKLGEIEEFEHHLDECLKLEPDMKEAINKWERHHCKTYNISYFRKKKFLNKGPKRRPTVYKWDIVDSNDENESGNDDENARQFEIFWFEKVHLNDRKKNDYFTRFVKMKINDIRIFLFNANYEMILRSEISITSLNDLTEIKQKTLILKEQHRKFKESLQQKPLSLTEESQSILFNHAIYTKQIFLQFLNNDTKNLLAVFGNENEMTANWIWKHRHSIQ